MSKRFTGIALVLSLLMTGWLMAKHVQARHHAPDASGAAALPHGLTPLLPSEDPDAAVMEHRRAIAAFSWASLSSTNLRVYAANLEALGCPLATRRAILMPELRDARQEALDQFHPWPFWADAQTRHALAQERFASLTNIYEEYDRICYELTGTPITNDEAVGERTLAFALCSVFLGDTERSKVLEVVRLHGVHDALKRSMERLGSSDDFGPAIFARLEARLRDLLTSAECQEWGFRLCALLAQDLGELEYTPQELRLLAQSAACPEIPNMLKHDGEQVSSTRLQLALPKVLGQARFTDLLMKSPRLEGLGQIDPKDERVREAIWSAYTRRAQLKQMELDIQMSLPAKLDQGGLVTSAGLGNLEPVFGPGRAVFVWNALGQMLDAGGVP